MGWNNTRTVLEMTKLREELSEIDPSQLKEHPDLAEKLERYGVQTDQHTSNITKILKELDNAIAEKKQTGKTETPVSHQALLSKMTTAAIIGIVSLSQVIAESGIGRFPQKGQRLAQRFSFELTMHLMANLDTLKETFRHIARASGADKKTELLAAETLALISLLLTLFAAGQNEKHETVRLVEQMKSHIEPGILALEELISEKILTRNIRGDKIEGLAIFLQQGKLTLQNDNFDGFITACYGALELLNITPDQLVKDLEKLNRFASAMAFALTTGLDDQTNRMTGIAQA